MDITLRIDDERFKSPLSDCPDLLRYLQDCFNGTAQLIDFEHFRERGISVAVNGVPPHIDTEGEDLTMQPLYQAVNTVTGWADAEIVETKRRWFLLAAEAALTVIHLAQSGKRGDVQGQWPMDEFTHRVWALAVAMVERGVTKDPWYGQNFGAVVQSLAIRGLKVERDFDGFAFGEGS